jgi:LytS/YehU family sensor histidine kinase
MSVLYAFMCLSAWYVCRFMPLKGADIGRVVLTHLLSAALISGIWVGAGGAIARFISRVPDYKGLAARYRTVLPVLFSAGILIYLLSVAVHYMLLASEQARQAEAHALEARLLARDAELKALKAQVNPHFLFNSLNSISALTSVDSARAREMCILLAEFLRMTLGLGTKNSIPLAEELSLLEHFLSIEKVRFGARLAVGESIEEASKKLQVPPLLLQPLIENAVTHGIANLPEGGMIRVTAQVSGSLLNIEIENTCDPEAASARRGGMGLENVRKRLEARYGREATLDAARHENHFRVKLSLPADAGEQPA